jgi:hypothetical protein
MFKVNNINDLELLYSVLRDKYPDNQIEITFNWNTKEYTVNVTEKTFICDPDVPLDLNIQVVYGDSVTGDTPLLLQKNGWVYIETIQSIFDEDKKVEYPEFKMFDQSIRLEKEYYDSDYKIWTDLGWININKVIRHKTDKKIYKILTNTGCVNVTEDHSLLNEDLSILKPKECNLTTKLLTSYPMSIVKKVNSITKEKAFVYGFFYKNGSICETHLTYKNVDNNVKNILQKEYNNTLIEISSDQYKLANDTLNVGVQGHVGNIVEEYKCAFYDSNKSKKVPTEILNSSKEIIQCFLDGYQVYNQMEIDHINQVGSAGLYYLMKRLGNNVSLNAQGYINITNQDPLVIDNQIKQIDLLDTELDFVYDIETECGRFQAGIGDIIVKNTDSVFLKFKYNRVDFEKNRVDTFQLATLCGNNLTKDIFNRNPIELEFEKVFHPFILLTKKRYIANKYENVKNPFDLKGVDAKGIALTRRDYCPMVKKCYKIIIDTIMDNENHKQTGIDTVKLSTELYKEYVDKIYSYDINIDDLIVSAMLAGSYKTKPVHVQLAEKLKERKEEVQVGDRIPYIFIESNDPKKAKSELGEDPRYAVQNGLKFNRVCYLEQLAKPILGFYRIVLKDNEILLDHIIDYTNDIIVKCGGKKLKPSDFKIAE